MQGIAQTYEQARHWLYNVHSFNNLYREESPSALRAWKKLIADPETHTLDVYFTSFPEDLKEPFERFVRPSSTANLCLHPDIAIEDWMHELDEQEGVDLYVVRSSIVFPYEGAVSFGVTQLGRGLIIGDPLEYGSVEYHRKAITASGVLGSLRRDLERQGNQRISRQH